MTILVLVCYNDCVATITAFVVSAREHSYTQLWSGSAAVLADVAIVLERSASVILESLLLRVQDPVLASACGCCGEPGWQERERGCAGIADRVF